MDLKKLSAVIDDEVVKNTKFKTLKTKVNNLGKRIRNGTSLIHINQYSTDKQNLGKNIDDVDKQGNTRHKLFSDYNCFEYRNYS